MIKSMSSYSLADILSEKMPGAIAAGLLLACLFLLPHVAPACGWWGDGESDADGEAVTVDSKGHTQTDATPAAESPEALVHQANHLRRFGASGYAGALRLYRQAAGSGYAPAQNNLGEMYERGFGVSADIDKAAQWYLIAARQGEGHAQHSLGNMLIAGRGVKQDITEGINWLKKSARAGHASACADLARIYAKGQYLQRDNKQAIHWWWEAERLGYPEAKTQRQTLESLLQDSATDN
ncbi:hypothetical protein MNBD_GAMMA09-2694 [hydrothermal vent metagenome]|uniref:TETRATRICOPEPTIDE REPEAT FAMILY PROTEIN n=1 Tax=hydrothermal vent metagenome TaxID=652676 RepID=A0A3B0XV38_9ZZZZ